MGAKNFIKLEISQEIDSAGERDFLGQWIAKAYKGAFMGQLKSGLMPKLYDVVAWESQQKHSVVKNMLQLRRTPLQVIQNSLFFEILADYDTPDLFWTNWFFSKVFNSDPEIRIVKEMPKELRFVA